MFMAVTPPDAKPSIPRYVRAAGGVRVGFGRAGRSSVPLSIAESGGYRVRFAHSGEGVLINTGGGFAGGDSMRVAADVGEGAAAVLTSQAAEKIYRSEGSASEIEISLALGPASRLAWLPQEQILFDGALLRRRLDVEMAADASLTLVESTVFGRIAMGEAVTSGAFADRWRIRRGGRLVFAEDVRLEGDIDAILARRATGDGARALATFLHIAPDAEACLDGARFALEGARCECGVSAFDGMLVARFLSADPRTLRADLVRFIERFRGTPMPRSWQT